MKHWLTIMAVAGGMLFGIEAASAADDSDDRVAFGIGFGFVNLDEQFAVITQGQNSFAVGAEGTEPYFTANLRIPIGDPHARGSRGGSGWRGFIEPEVGYYDADAVEDVLAGVNFVGAMPYGGIDFFVGAGLGVHFLDVSQDFPGGASFSESDELLGANAHFGVDVHMSDKVSVFGVGRFDVVEDSDSPQPKAFLGLRFGG